MTKYYNTITKVDGINYMDFTPVYEAYHEMNGGRLSALVEEYKANHDETNSPEFTHADIVDIYGTSLEKNNGGLNPEDLIITAIYAGLALAEKYAENEEVDKRERHCIICGEPLHDFGNNAAPYADGVCCNKCNLKFVVPERIRRMAK